MKSVIFVVTHKPYEFPSDPLYVPIQAGAAIDPPLDILRDDTGDNISNKNRNYCELTALYWIWKHCTDDFIGVCHYRRYFGKNLLGKKENRLLDSETLMKLTEEYDVILPIKRHYWIETNYTQYIHAHHKKDLDTVRRIVLEQYPDYLESFDEVMEKTSGHRFNMFIMERSHLIEYCSWLFDILFRVEQLLDLSDYSEYDSRVFGFLGERLLDVWLIKNKVRYKELPVIYTEKQHLIYKVYSFIKRKAVYGK